MQIVLFIVTIHFQQDTSVSRCIGRAGIFNIQGRLDKPTAVFQPDISLKAQAGLVIDSAPPVRRSSIISISSAMSIALAKQEMIIASNLKVATL